MFMKTIHNSIIDTIDYRNTRLILFYILDIMYIMFENSTSTEYKLLKFYVNSCMR